MKSRRIATIYIQDLRIPAIIGINDWEKVKKQEIIINVALTYDAARASRSDSLNDALDYKNLKKKIITYVTASRYGLLERLTSGILDLVMQEKKTLSAKVRVDKPQALRYAKSVAVEMSSGPKTRPFYKK